MGMGILLLGALMVGIPVMVIGFVAAWRERHYRDSNNNEQVQ